MISPDPFRSAAAGWLDRARSILVYFTLLSPSFFWGGKSATGEAVFRTLACLLFVSYAPTLFTRKNASRRTPIMPVFILSCIPYLIYVLVQWMRGHAAFSGLHWGTVVRYVTADGLAQVACYVMLAAVFYAHFNTRNRVRLAVLFLSLEMVLLMAVGFYHERSELNRPETVLGINMATVVHYYSFFIHRNHFGAFLSVTAPLLLVSVIDYVRRWSIDRPLELRAIEKLLFLLILPAAVASMMDASARAALVWFFLNASLLLLFFFAWGRRWVFAGVAAAGVALLAIVVRAPDMALAKLGEDFGNRLAFARAGADILKDFPFFGCGLGTFYHTFFAYNPISPENLSPNQPYNHFLELLIETGPLGFAAFVLPLGVLAMLCVPRILKSPSRWEKHFGLCSLIVMATTALMAVGDNYLTTPAIATVFLLYLSLAVRSAEGSFRYDLAGSARPESPAASRSPLPLIVFFIAAAVAAPVLLFTHRDYTASFAAYSTSKSETALRRAVQVSPEHLAAWTELQHYYYNEAAREIGEKRDGVAAAKKAVEAGVRMTELAPAWPKAWDALGESEILAGDRLKGLSHLGFAAQLQPLNRDRYLYLVILALKVSRAAPWRDERRIASQLAYAWIAKASTLPRPLTPIDHGYIGNFSAQQNPVDLAYVRVAIQKYYASRAEPNAPSPVELAS